MTFDFIKDFEIFMYIRYLTCKGNNLYMKYRSSHTPSRTYTRTRVCVWNKIYFNRLYLPFVRIYPLRLPVYNVPGTTGVEDDEVGTYILTKKRKELTPVSDTELDCWLVPFTLSWSTVPSQTRQLRLKQFYASDWVRSLSGTFSQTGGTPLPRGTETSSVVPVRDGSLLVSVHRPFTVTVVPRPSESDWWHCWTQDDCRTSPGTVSLLWCRVGCGPVQEHSGTLFWVGSAQTRGLGAYDTLFFATTKSGDVHTIKQCLVIFWFHVLWRIINFCEILWNILIDVQLTPFLFVTNNL